MAYSTGDDIRKMLPEEMLVELTDDEGLAEVDQARVEEAVAQADAEIDSYLAKRYSVPLDPVPEVVRKLSVDMAIYNLFSRRVSEVPPARADRYRAAVRRLEGIAKGIVSLGVEPAPSAHADGRAETNRPKDENVFTRDKLKGF